MKDREAAETAQAGIARRLHALQERLFVDDTRAVLVVLQAMDTGGKDGTMKHAFGTMNPTRSTSRPSRSPPRGSSHTPH